MSLPSNLYWRVHPYLERPFSIEDATSTTFHSADTRPGYSCFANPWHLFLYLDANNLYQTAIHQEIIAFSGTPIGTGADGEILAMPDMAIVRRFSLVEWEAQLATTPLPDSPKFSDTWTGRNGDYLSWAKTKAMFEGPDYGWTLGADPVIDVILKAASSKTAGQALYFHVGRPGLGVGTELIPGGPGGRSRMHQGPVRDEELLDWVWLSQDAETAIAYALYAQVHFNIQAAIYLARPTAKVEERTGFHSGSSAPQLITKSAVVVAQFPMLFEQFRTFDMASWWLDRYPESRALPSPTKIREDLLEQWRLAVSRGTPLELPGIGVVAEYKPRPMAQGPYFHGTNAVFSPGDTVRPAVATGAVSRFSDHDFYDSTKVYLTNQPHLAARYAFNAAKHGGGEPHVYEVRPIGAVYADPEYVESGFGSDQVVANLAEVIRELPFAEVAEQRYLKTAAWRDVRNKAREIRSGGGVKIIAAAGDQITAEVKSTTGSVYQTSLLREPGTKSVAMWECFLPDAPVLMADGTERPISDVVPGDEVITHEGRIARVMRAEPKPYDGDIVTVRFRGDYRPLVATAGHEVYAANRDYALRGAGRDVLYKTTGSTVPVLAPRDGWIPIEQLAPSDYLSRSVVGVEEPLVVTCPAPVGNRAHGYTHDDLDVKVDADLAYWLGWYMAEGSLVGRGHRVVFSLAPDEEWVCDRLDAITQAHFGVVGTRRYRESTIDYRVSHFALAHLARTLIGSGSTTKRLAPGMLVLPLPEQESFMEAWVAGDGHIEPRGVTTLHAANETSMRQAREVLGRLGIVSNLRTAATNPGGLASTQNAGPIWRLQWAGGQRTISQFRQDGMIWHKITSVERSHYEGDVWDIEVEEDHSFRAYGMNVHNCSCPWAAYSWGRSGRWRKYEGRMCAHALALVYEAQAQEWGGNNVTEGEGHGEEITFYEAPPIEEWRMDTPTAPRSGGDDLGRAAALLPQGLYHGTVRLDPSNPNAPDTYRPWTIDYGSEREVDIPDGTEITIDGWMQAETVSVSPEQQRRSQTAEPYSPESYYLVYFEWPRTFTTTNRRVTAQGANMRTAKLNNPFGMVIDEITGLPYLNGQQVRSYPTWHPSAGISDFGFTGKKISSKDDFVIRRGLVVSVNDLALGRRIVSGNVSAQDILRCFDNGRVGEWWFTAESADLVDVQDNYANVHESGEPLAGTTEGEFFDTEPGDSWVREWGERHAREQGFASFKDMAIAQGITQEKYQDPVNAVYRGQFLWDGGDIGVVLEARRPSFDGQLWDPETDNPDGKLMGNSYLPVGHQIELLKVHYNPGTGWRTLSADGIRVTAAKTAGLFPIEEDWATEAESGTSNWHNGIYSGVLDADAVGYRAMGDIEELRSAFARGAWQSDKRFTLGFEGATHFTSDPNEVVNFNGAKVIVEVDLHGLPFKVIQPPVEQGGQWYVNGDRGEGLGVEGDIPARRILRVGVIRGGAIEWYEPYDFLDPDGPGWAHFAGKKISLKSFLKTAEFEAADPLAALGEVFETIDDGEHTHSGLIIKAVDSGRVLLTQRTPYADDPEGVYGRWEFPGGGIGEGEDAFTSAVREFREETGLVLPEDWAVAGHYENGKYLGVVVLVPHEAWTTNASMLSHEVMGVGWFSVDQIEDTDLGREELDKTDWTLVKDASSLFGTPEVRSPHGSPAHQDAGRRDGADLRGAGASGGVGGAATPGRAADSLGSGLRARVAAQNTVDVIPSARKAYQDLQPNVRPAVLAAVKSLRQDSFPSGAKTLDGPYRGYCAIHVVTIGGHYRVLYKINGSHITVVMVGSRENFYDNAKGPKDTFEKKEREREEKKARELKEQQRKQGAKKGDGVNTCKFCGSESLWDNFFDAEGYGATDDSNGAKWDTLCNDCGKFQNRRNKKMAELAEATLHEEPEGALPSTDGSAEEVDDLFSPEAIAQRAAALGGDDSDIAAAANAYLAKTAVKVFSPKEQLDLIEEGAVDGVTASNLDRLDIEGTHYQQLEERFRYLDESESAATDLFL